MQQAGFSRQVVVLDDVARILAEATGIPRMYSSASQSIVYNGYEYKSLAGHDPICTQPIDEKGKLYNLAPGWSICPHTPDAVYVCKCYPWAAHALVLADGSSYFTALALSRGARYIPGLQQLDALAAL